MNEDSSSLPEGPQQSDNGGDSADSGNEPDLSPRFGKLWNEIWDALLRLGLGETAIRLGTAAASILVILLVVWVLRSFYLRSAADGANPLASVLSAPQVTSTPAIPIPQIVPEPVSYARGIPRLALIHTNRPTRSRFAMIQYTISEGDSLFGIADRYGLRPQTILFSNRETLYDDPHRIYPGQVLTIPPIDGAVYQWHAGDGLNGVAEFYSVTPDDIINWPSNNLSRESLGDLSDPHIEPGTLLFIPGGTRAFTSWSAPWISRSDPAKARIFGPGFCGEMYTGYIGNGSFVWPTTETWLSGYDYSPDTNHWGIDVSGRIGNAIFAADSGVVVYAGWNDWGYGYVVVIDHGNGWQTLYAHLDSIAVGCGQSVSQGTVIAGLGTTGRSSGPHLHFEIMSEAGSRVNPHSFLLQ